MMSERKKITFGIIFFVLLFIGIFYKVFFLHLIPFPGDLLVSFFFPYNSGGWDGYSTFITHKEFISADVVRQIFPWRIIEIDIVKSGGIPLWNPYTFSGTPLAANLQSAVFYPLNFLFFIVNSKLAWVIYILSQPVLAFLFMYLFIREINLSRISAAFSGLAFAFGGFFIVWLELGVVNHSGLWLPLILFGLTKFFKTKKFIYILVSSFGLAFSLLGGHAQTSTYVLLTSVSYLLILLFFKYREKVKIKEYLSSFLFIIFGIGLGAIQLIPSVELLGLSPRSDRSALIFHNTQLPWKNLVTLFAPDFFGNPGTNNFWGSAYGEHWVYSGIIATTLALIGFFHFFKDKQVRFFSILFIISLLLALPTPISDLLVLLKIPVLSSGLPSRILFLTQTSIAVLSAFGIETILNKKKIDIKPFVIITGIYLFIWLFVLFAAKIFPSGYFVSFMSIAKRNLILPTALFALVLIVSALKIKFQKLSFIFIAILIFAASFEYQYQMYKYLPFSKINYIFPDQVLTTYLKGHASYFRVIGYDRAVVETNLLTYWHIQTLEGYDPLFIRRYGVLTYASRKGYSEDIDRSDAGIQSSLPKDDSYAKKVILDLTGTKFMLDKDDLGNKETPGTSWKFPPDRYNLIWQDGKFKVYENKKIVPRAAIFYNFEIIKNDRQILSTLFSDKFDYHNSLIITKAPSFSSKSLPQASASILNYDPNKVEIRADMKSNGFLFLSDNYYPGWNAYVDGRKVEIFQADYTFRAVPVGKGNHNVVFKYEPISFKIGALISITSFVLLILFPAFLRKKYVRRQK